MSDISYLLKLIVGWGLDRNIIQDSNLSSQLLKLQEELDELEEAILAQDKNAIRDAIGDMTVVLTLMAEIYGKDHEPESYVEGFPDDDHVTWLEDCVEGAYDEIKDRKGKLINGVFVKEIDLDPTS